MKNTNLKIGITEYGDAGVDFRWENQLKNLNGVILITKNLNPVFQRKVTEHIHDCPIIVHCTCTGWGGGSLEPHVPDYRTQLNWLRDFICNGFPAENIVLRIDPVFPSEAGFKRLNEVLAYFASLNLPTDKIRYRMSIVDEYPHVRERFAALNWKPLYNGRFYPSWEQIKSVGEFFTKYPYKFATCAEDKLAKQFPNTFTIKGCISKDDLDIMGVSYDPTLFENPQKRSGCHCLSCKTELLKPRKTCPHGCVYCFWK